MNLRAYLVVLFASLVALVAAAVAPPRAAVAAAGDEAVIERGSYLVLQVGMCVNCHGSGLKGEKLDFLAAGLPAAHFAPRTRS